MAACSSPGFSADSINQAAPNEVALAADPIYQAAAASACMSGAPGTLPTYQEALNAPPPAQGALVMEMVKQPRMPLPTAPSVEHQRLHCIDMLSGQQTTGYEQEMVGSNESTGLPYGPYIHNEISSVDSYDCSLPSNATNSLHVEGFPSDCTIRELEHIFRPFTGFCQVSVIIRRSDNSRAVAIAEFNTPVQAFSAMESLQGYLFDIDDYSDSLRLHFYPPCPRLDVYPRGRH